MDSTVTINCWISVRGKTCSSRPTAPVLISRMSCSLMRSRGCILFYPSSFINCISSSIKSSALCVSCCVIVSRCLLVLSRAVLFRPSSLNNSVFRLRWSINAQNWPVNKLICSPIASTVRNRSPKRSTDPCTFSILVSIRFTRVVRLPPFV